MAKKMLIDATHAEETRVVVVDGNKVEEFDFESENKRQLAGNIYLAKVTRVEPSLQAAFVDYGGNRHGFLAFSEIHPDYYQIPVADREALMAEEEAFAEAQKDEDEKPKRKPSRSRSRSRSKTQAEKTNSDDAVASTDISGMETIDLDTDDDERSDTDVTPDEGSSPMERVSETPVEEPVEDTAERAAPDVGGDSGTAAEASPAESEEEDAETSTRDHSTHDDSIESVADEDDSEDIRPVRKPRPRRYKIQEVIKVRQILLVQVVKEERGNKGAALTTYLSLAGRYCVLMPNTARGGGISRKITNAADRKKLKEIASEIDVPRGAGLIVRTAGAKRTKAEIKRDYEYLQRLWEQIRELTLKSIAPAKIYEEGDLIKRSIRDLYNREIDEVLVEGERGYRIAKDFMKMIMPSHAKNVKHYVDQQPLFARHQVESYLSGMFNPTVQLKSGGYIVIGVTEALVAIDVNSGRATKEGSIEETATKTNLEAADEVARQLRLRDLAGLIVIDFIDMDERRNNAAVEKRMKERLKTDRARIQVGRISGFGLMEMSRQRLRPGMIEATTQPCPACHGTGLIRSDDNLALSILRQIEEEGVRRRSREVLLKCPVGIANYLMNQKREHVAQIEARYGLSVRIEGDHTLVSPDFTMEKFKTATRNVPEAPPAQFVSASSTLMSDIDDESDADSEQDEASEAPAASETGGDGQDKPKKSRRRRSRRRKPKSGGNGADGNGSEENNGAEGNGDAQENAPKTEVSAEADSPEANAVTEEPKAEEQPKPKPKRTRAPRKKKEPELAEAEPKAEADEAKAEEKPKPKRTRAPRKKKEPDAAEAAPTEAAPTEAAATEDTTTEPVKEETVTSDPMPAEQSAPPATEEPTPSRESEDATELAPAPVAETPPESAPAPTPEPAAEAPESEPVSKPKRRGWWSLG
ncbi:Rne/Rng family ribonuclease [uncultured Roseovarius sp.]|uniref:Rne/Rng family ribonuclease n=1 Tax=uncultured Roseovarius sp. TaxID=293344 RepID=UPI002619505D|nr:Rne/Rng family ribonuclease [uncultured Roseovarius sp.]